MRTEHAVAFYRGLGGVEAEVRAHSPRFWLRSPPLADLADVGEGWPAFQSMARQGTPLDAAAYGAFLAGLADQFRDIGWHAADMVSEMEQADNFYFDKLCQIQMPAWSRGRIALVGDAAYCPSPGAGRGGSLASDGAAALGRAMAAAVGDYALAFRRYDEQFRPFIEQVQADAARTVRESLIPRTEEDIRARNARDIMF